MNFGFLFTRKTLEPPNIYREAELGSKAKAFLADETYQNAVRSVREGIHQRWADSPVGDVEGQHELRLMLKLLGDLEANIESAVNTGYLASAQIAEEQKKKK